MFNSVSLATNKVPILFNEDGNEFIFNIDGKIIRIYNIGYFSLYNLEKYGKPELKVNEFYYTDGKDNIDYVLNSFTNRYPINRIFIEDYDKINNYKSVSSIRKYNLKTSQPDLIKYLEKFKIEKIKEIQHEKD